MKKAQIQSQMFIYVFAIIVISLVLFFGIKSISSFTKDTSKVVLVNFINDMKSRILGITSEYDSISEVTLDLPKDYVAVCFINSKLYGRSSEFSPSDYGSILNEYITTDNNVFIIKKGNVLEREFDTGKIKVSSPFCVSNSNGRIIFKVIGKGRYAEVSPS